MKPIGNNVLIKRDKIKTKTSSGLFLESSTNSIFTGKVIQVGNGTKAYTMKLKVGDRVRYQDNGTLINYLDNQCLLISELHCIAIL